MKKILLVDDDSLVLRLYQDGLSRRGFEVHTAGDGLEAVKALRARKPDLVVLDLMMPKFTGVDVLKFIRSQPDLAAVPVIVLSNSYMNEVAEQAAKIGMEMALLKVRCSPPVLSGIINDILAGKRQKVEVSQLLAIARPAAATSPADSAAPPPPAKSETPPAAPVLPQAQPEAQSPERSAADEFYAKARREFLDDVPKTRATIRDLCQSFTNARNDARREMCLQDFYRKIHFVTAAAGLARCHHIALLASAFEALLFEAAGKPALITPSLLRTIAFTVDFLGTLFDRARESNPNAPLPGQVLVVDDDPLSNRLVNAALRRAQLQPRSTEDPFVALQWLHENRYDLVLLDIEMPGMDGFELCKSLRALPGYRRTPVIYVTGHSDFDTRARSVLSGSNDLIAKPIFPMELAVKVLTHLLISQLAESS